MPNRFIFRQVYFSDLPTILADGEIRCKNHINPQRCHQASYQTIVNRRGTQEFPMPDGGVVNDYVPFYFSPITSFTYTIFKKNVPLVSPSGVNMGIASEDERIFLVVRPDDIDRSGLQYCFSDLALNSNAPPPSIKTNIDQLEEHVDWALFDDSPTKARIPEISYNGVCEFFLNRAEPISHMNRSSKRMAEFLVHNAVPVEHIVCIIAKTDAMRDTLQQMMNASAWNIPVYTNRGCYFG